MNNDLKEFGLSDEELFSHVDINDLDSEKITAPRYSYWHSVFRVFFKKKINIIVLALLGVIVLMSYLYPLFVDFDKYGNILDSTTKHLSPAKAMSQLGAGIHWILGTGASGQSTFDAIWYGSRISISLAFVCAAINMTVGVIVGAIWGFSKKFDLFMIEVYNIVANVPYILVISVLVMLFTPSFWVMVLAFTITGWVTIAYFIRTQVIIIGLGLSDRSLGRLIYESQNAMVTPGWEFEFWSPVVIAAIISVVLYVVGQNIGDASDPRTHM